MPEEIPQELTLHFYEEAISEEDREKFRGAAREACWVQGVEPTADVVEVVALEAAHKLLQRASAIVSEVVTAEELESALGVEPQHIPAEDQEELVANAVERLVDRHADYLFAPRGHGGEDT